MKNKFRFPFRCAKVLPLTFDESLSYYEVLCKMRDTINALIAAGETGLTPWGQIAGDIEDQEDLQEEFRGKQNKLGVNPENTTAILEGLEIDGVKYAIGGETNWGNIHGDIDTQTDLKAILDRLEDLIDEKASIAVNGTAPATQHLLKLTVNGVTYDIESQLPIASPTTLGGVKAAYKTTSDTVEVKIGTDGKLYVPAATTGQAVADVVLGNESVVDPVTKIATLVIADEVDIDYENPTSLIDAANVRYAAKEAIKDPDMSDEDRTAIKENLEILDSDIGIENDLTHTKTVHSELERIDEALDTKASVSATATPAQLLRTLTVDDVPYGVTPVVASEDPVSGAPDLKSLNVDGIDYNIPSGGGGGASYEAGNGIAITAGTTADYKISAKPNASNNGIVATSDGLGVNFNRVQEKLTAGANISISGSTISATDTNTTYAAGEGISIVGAANTISVTSVNGLTFEVVNSIPETPVAGRIYFVRQS